MNEKPRSEVLLENDHPPLTHEEMVMLEAADPSAEKQHWDSLDEEGKAKLVRRMKKHIRINYTSSCHESTYKSRDKKGYRRLKVYLHDGTPKMFSAHRMILPIRGVPLPRYYEVDHVCKVTRCCNSDHLIVVTLYRHRMTTEGSVSKKKADQTVCDYGHPLTEENTTVRTRKSTGRLRRECRICVNARQREAYRKKKLEVLAAAGEQLTFTDIMEEARNDNQRILPPRP